MSVMVLNLNKLFFFLFTVCAVFIKIINITKLAKPLIICVCRCVCVYKVGAFSCWLLKLRALTKGCIPTLLYGNQVWVGHTVEENTGLTATRLLLYCHHGDIKAPGHQWHSPALWPLAMMLLSYLLLGEARCSAMWRCK